MEINIAGAGAGKTTKMSDKIIHVIIQLKTIKIYIVLHSQIMRFHVLIKS